MERSVQDWGKLVVDIEQDQKVMDEPITFDFCARFECWRWVINCLSRFGVLFSLGDDWVCWWSCGNKNHVWHAGSSLLYHPSLSFSTQIREPILISPLAAEIASVFTFLHNHLPSTIEYWRYWTDRNNKVRFTDRWFKQHKQIKYTTSNFVRYTLSN